MFVFGSGVLIGTQLNVANPTPINFGLVQKVSVDTSVSVKELYGQFAFPVAVGSGTRKVNCKASLARFSGQAIGRLFYNQVPALGSTISQFAEVHQRPRHRPVHDRHHNSARISWPTKGSLTPLAAFRLSMSRPERGTGSIHSIRRLASILSARRDQGSGVLISYTYTASSAQATTTRTLAIGNPLIGPTSTFSATLFATDPTNNAQFSVTLNQCVASKFSFDTNIEDFAKPDFEFQAFANAAGQVMTFNFGDAA